MRGIRRLSARQKRGLLCGSLALLLLVAGFSFHYVQAHGSLLPLAQKVVPPASDASASGTKFMDAQSAAPDVHKSESADSSAGNETAESQSRIEPKMNQILDSNVATATNNCNDKMRDAVADYNTDVQKKKDDLISRITFPPVPVSISSNYLKSYNDDVTELFNNYLSEANKENCTWPIKAPATLQLQDLGL